MTVLRANVETWELCWECRQPFPERQAAVVTLGHGRWTLKLCEACLKLLGETATEFLA